MFIRMFVYAKDNERAIEICDKYLKHILKIPEKREVSKNEKYWKIDGIYVIELSVSYDSTILMKKEFIDNIKNSPIKLTVYGEPIEELLIVKDNEVQDSDMKEVEMINIFFNE